MGSLFIGKAFACAAGQISVSLAIGGNNCFDSSGAYIVALFTQAIDIGGILAVLMILWGVYKYVSSAGDQAKTKDAKDIIVSAIIGLALLLLVRVLLPLFQIQ